jgi:hypothetical protein
MIRKRPKSSVREQTRLDERRERLETELRGGTNPPQFLFLLAGVASPSEARIDYKDFEGITKMKLSRQVSSTANHCLR